MIRCAHMDMEDLNCEDVVEVVWHDPDYSGEFSRLLALIAPPTVSDAPEPESVATGGIQA